MFHTEIPIRSHIVQQIWVFICGHSIELDREDSGLGCVVYDCDAAVDLAEEKVTGLVYVFGGEVVDVGYWLVRGQFHGEVAFYTLMDQFGCHAFFKF